MDIYNGICFNPKGLGPFNYLQKKPAITYKSVCLPGMTQRSLSLHTPLPHLPGVARSIILLTKRRSNKADSFNPANIYLVPAIPRLLYYILGPIIMKIVSSFNSHLWKVYHMPRATAQ